MITVIQIKDKQFTPYIESGKIQQRIEELAKSINEAYVDKDLVFVVVLNGAFMFASDLIKHVTVPCEITFVKVSSYEGGLATTGRVDEIIGLDRSIVGKDVIIVEDIVDTGITIDKMYKLLELNSPKTLKICSLLYKPEAHKGRVKPDIVGFEIPNRFVVGYGLDYDQKGRNYDAIYQLKD